ncbi:hypothetical protein BHAOGJBA_2944 [Methylobacterium hispanicum]|uniref:Lysozyme inhibitor LprI N-terminal domain-containing protein n=1 Tax=Methylobacterium hispanicum TaxID=270350 RepID=A0AAV4ZMN9_9HYPH|nr:hypothetical protein [Methylobacterium hispanicum]GJD89417.1 hypothetical protein BHAOGJBA_2944 [Methylobacterium hispanicum]
MMRQSAFVLLAMLCVPHAQAAPRADYEGIWARTEAECRDRDGPNSRTLIEMGGKDGPLFDRYENHCRIERVTGGAGSHELTLRCFEFWEEFRKNGVSNRATARLVQKSARSLRIDGESYTRCRR